MNCIEGEDLDPSEIKFAARRLNSMIKNWVVHGFRLWKRQRKTITLVAGQSSYTIGQEASGTTTSTTANKLVDLDADFITDATVGDKVLNTSDSTDTTISAIDSKTHLSVASDIFTSGESYTITTADESLPRPDRILECNRIYDGNEVTMTAMSLQEYNNLPNKSQTGTPINYFYDPVLNNGRLYFWLTPGTSEAAGFTVEIVAVTQVNDLDNSTDTFDFPQEWYEPLIINLAYKLSGAYGGLSATAKRDLKKDAKDLLDDVVDYDQDSTSVYIQPEVRHN
jgi:hypothetical protein